MSDTDSSEDDQSPVCENMDTVNDNSEVASNKIEPESVAQEANEIVDMNQLDINELTRRIKQLSIDKSSGNLTNLDAILARKNQILDFKIENKNSWHRYQVVSV